MIKTISLSKVFKNKELQTRALNEVSFEVDKGDFVAVMGPSGCGKTTLLNILGLLDNASSGKYFFMDKEISKMSEKQKAFIRKNNIGFIFQNFNLIDELSVYENIELPLVYLGVGSKERKQKVMMALDLLQIANRAALFPSNLSGGQQQKIAIARAIVTNPNLILADEPTGNLDSNSGTEIMNTLENLNREGTTIIMVTHSHSDADYSRRIIRLFDGKIIHENFVKRLII
ncbi:MAG: ABC transporter ATP-binding protein [Bacteroidales bacterium]|nr:ABC transporter ATP-binding protein [Bacteroidales bacterium]